MNLSVINYTQEQLVPLRATPVGYGLSPRQTFEEWQEDGRKLNLIDKWKNFAIGDWLLQGADRFGEACYQEVDEYKWGSHDKLKKLVWVARNVPPQNRNMELTWTHHHHVAGLPEDEQVWWLLYAERNQLTAESLKQEIVAAKQEVAARQSAIAENEDDETEYESDVPFTTLPNVEDEEDETEGEVEDETTSTTEYRQLREQLADVQHGIWAHWMGYLFSCCRQNEDGSATIPADKVERWMRQQGAAYSDLTDEERESDRHQADKVLAVLGN